MDAIDLMKEEHKNIKRGLAVIRKMCISIIETGEVAEDDFYEMIDFIRNYADKHHHNKEESILFKRMEEVIGDMVKAPLSGMLVEHDLGRLFTTNLEEALKRVKEGDKDSRVDVIANAVGYTDLLNRHIEKEDKAIYSFARRALSPEILEEVNSEAGEVEKIGEGKNTQGNYMRMLDELESKWSKKGS